MIKGEYAKAQAKLIEAGKLLDQVDLQAMLGQIGDTETFAPILDPTLYRKAQANLEAIKNLAEAGLKFQDAFKKTFRVVLETTVETAFRQRDKRPRS